MSLRTALHRRLALLARQLLPNVETAAPASLRNLDYVAGVLVQMPTPALPSRLHHTTSEPAVHVLTLETWKRTGSPGDS